MSEQPKWYDEEKEMPDRWRWIVLALFCASIIGYGIATWLFVKDGPRNWEYGTLPDTPAESIYNTRMPEDPAKGPRQVPPLPGRRDKVAP